MKFLPVVTLCAALLLTSSGHAQNSSPLREGRIAYVMTDLFWSVYQTADAREECPEGFNDGPREQFDQLFAGAGPLKVTDTQLMLEQITWHPETNHLEFPFKSVQGTKSWGMNLDGQTTPEDFQHPDGKAGIDNQVYRAVGCIIGFRGPDGVEYIFQNKAIIDEKYNRMMIELEGVDDLRNDPQVDVNVYRGRDRLLTDASGEQVVPGGTQRVDRRWGKSLIRKTRGEIVDGVLITVPIDELVVPWMNLRVPSIHRFKDARFRLRLSETRAEGQLGAYADVDTWYYQLIRNDSTHHLSNGQISALSLYRALTRFADAYPDPATGANTAISTALDIKLTQVFVVD
ncbi:MAG: hypothetical protein Cons2KO_17660 [Congregibacter sp.]